MIEQAPAPACTVLWQRLDSPGLERFMLEQGSTPVLSGTVVLELEGQPATVRYRVITTADWRTNQVTVTLNWGDVERRLELHVDDAQRWWQGKVELTHLRGLVDVDLSVTPATNTLPLWRFDLKPGERREVTAAWVKFPGLGLEPLPQRYTRISEQDYRYESGTDLADFSADLRVDDMGLVSDYLSGDRGWRRLQTNG